MSLFEKLVKTAVNVATLPAAIVKDVVTMGGIATGHQSYIAEKLDEIKRDVED